MKIGLVNASPQGNKSTTAKILDMFSEFIGDYRQVIINLETKRDLKEECFDANDCDALVIASPLYLNLFSSSLLQFMSEMEFRHHSKNIPVAFIVHNDLYDGKEGKLALEIAKNWCDKLHLQYIMGISIGGAGAIRVDENRINDFTVKGPFSVMALGIRGKNKKDDQYLTISMTQFGYKALIEKSWKKQIKKNGLSSRDLNAKPSPK